MKGRVLARGIVPVGCLMLALAAGTAQAGKSFLRVEAEASPENVARDSAVQVDCVFGNVSHFDTVESFMTIDVRFSDGTTIKLADAEPLGFLAPGDAFLFRGFAVVADDAALGTAVAVCSAESTIVGGPRPEGQTGTDSDAATFGVFDVVTPDAD